MTKKGILTGIKIKKTKDKQKQKNILTANLFTGLILIKKVLIFFFEISKIQDYIAQSNKGKIKKEKEAQIKELKERLKKLEAQIKKDQKTKLKN